MTDETMHTEQSEATFSEARSHLKVARESFKKQWMSLLPADFWRYRRQARREFLLGMRTLVDAAIGRIEQAGPDVRTTGRQKVEVEVD